MINSGLTGEDLPFHTCRKTPFLPDHLELDRLHLIPSYGNRTIDVSNCGKVTIYKITESSFAMQR